MALSNGEPLAGGTSARRPEFEIRSGVMFPNWDAVRPDAAESALLAMYEAVGVGTPWTGHKQPEDRVYRVIVTNYAEHACAPSVSRLSEMTGMDLAELHTSLRHPKVLQ